MVASRAEGTDVPIPTCEGMMSEDKSKRAHMLSRSAPAIAIVAGSRKPEPSEGTRD
jgi:hypothetical protein